MAAEQFASKGKTIVLPIATSTEFQRIYAASNNVWNLAESDITQCEILLTQAKLMDVDNVSLLTANNDYGKSFYDWFAFQASELGLSVDRIDVYSSISELRTYVSDYSSLSSHYNKVLLFAPGSEDDAIAFDEEIGKIKLADKQFKFPIILCSDMMNSVRLASSLKNHNYEGISPDADPESGFTNAYITKFDDVPMSGEAHFYDAVLLLEYALTAKAAKEKLNDAIHRVVDGRNGNERSWLPADLHNTLVELQQGGQPNLKGVTSDWSFDSRTHASVTSTIYNHWVFRDGKYYTVDYLSAKGTKRSASSIQAWDWQNNNMQTFNKDQKDFNYPELKGRWAVVVGTSNEWPYYRHQADALAMYQLLKQHGYDDEHIILIIEDNIAYDPHNKHPGVVKVRPDGENVYTDVHVDYKLSDINMNDLNDILLGKKCEKFPQVIESGPNDNVIVFWCGHGGFGGRLMWGNTSESCQSLKKILYNMQQANKYRKLLFTIDACFGGSIGEACLGLPGALFITSATSKEPSKADMRDKEMDIWLSNGFTRAFQEQIDKTSDISIRDLYYILARHTVGSHATIYNIENYGNIYSNSMEEFLY